MTDTTHGFAHVVVLAGGGGFFLRWREGGTAYGRETGYSLLFTGVGGKGVCVQV
jgi:hypothetical protein